MVGSKLFNPNRLGLISVIATLFVAAVVNGEHEVVYDAAHKSDVFLQCSVGGSSPWTVEEKDSSNKKVFKLPPETEGCFKSNKPVVLNSTSKFIIKFYSDGPQNESGNLIVSLVPSEGSCGKECEWDVSKDAMYKKGEWVTAEHTFPQISTKGYYIHLQADKLKGKFLLESLAIPNPVSSSFEREHLGGISVTDRLVYENGTVTNAPGGCVGIGDFSKNLLFTTASLLTLNTLLN